MARPASNPAAAPSPPEPPPRPCRHTRTPYNPTTGANLVATPHQPPRLFIARLQACQLPRSVQRFCLTLLLATTLCLARPTVAGELTGRQASTLMDEAISATSSGDTATAVKLWAELVPWLRRNTPAGTVLLPQSLLQLGDAQSSRGQLPQSEASYQEALLLARSLADPRPRLLATILNNLADLYADLERFADAKSLLQESLELKITALGRTHPEVGIAHSNLGDLLREMGELEAAGLQFASSLAVLSPQASTQPLALAAVLNNAARLQQYQGAWNEAQRSLEQAQQLRLEALPPNHGELALGWNNLGMYALSRGDHATAELHLKRAYAQAKRAYGDEHAFSAVQLANLARLDAERGELLLSIQKMQRAQQTLDRLLGTAHPDSLHNLADLLVLQHRRGQSKTLTAPLEHLLRSRFALFSDQARRLQPRERLLLLRRRDPSWYLADALATTQPAAARLALALRLNTQGLLQELQREQRQSGSAAASTRQRHWITAAEVAAALPSGAALIEIRRFLDPARLPRGPEQAVLPWRYSAYVLSARGDLKVVDLGLQTTLEPLQRMAYSAIAEQLSDASEQLEALSAAILKPLRLAAGDATTWFIVPDAGLHQVPFQALEPERNVRLLSTGRDLLRLRQRGSETAAPAVVAGNPTISKPLAATSTEVLGIAKMLGIIPVEGKAFNKALLSQLKRPRILHLATHGFWQPPPKPIIATQTIDPVPTQDPMLTSGVVVSNDDYFSAAEFLRLDLSGTELVTLSGCSTGLGDLHDSEGLYGLQRGVQVAGARSVLTSLWPVDDAATSDWMLRYYTQLSRGRGRAQALAAVQSEFRQHPIPAWRHPYYWAAWQLVGDWRPIRGL